MFLVIMVAIFGGLRPSLVSGPVNLTNARKRQKPPPTVAPIDGAGFVLGQAKGSAYARVTSDPAKVAIICLS